MFASVLGWAALLATCAAATFRGPCSVVLEKMRTAGYLVRDCSYMDPYVYWRVEHRMSWDGARSACQQVAAGDLVSIHNFDERHVVQALAQNNYVNFRDQSDHWHGVDQGVWIGLHDPDAVSLPSVTNKRWQWSDETPLDYKDWLSGQPDFHANKEHCVQATLYARKTPGAVAFGWNDIGCRWGMKAVCKAPRMAVFP